MKEKTVLRTARRGHDARDGIHAPVEMVYAAQLKAGQLIKIWRC